jgi:hypothetical protein
LLRFYLPRMRHHGYALFDDTDAAKLRGYLNEHRGALASRLGDARYHAMLDDCERLAQHQRGWRDMSRLERSLAYALSRGRIDEAQAEHYRRRPELWYTRLIATGVTKGVGKVFRKLGALISKFSFDWLDRQLVLVTRFLFSQKYRARVGRVLVLHRIASWQRRGQLTPAEAAYLRAHVKSDEGTVYITDFGIHLAIKPPIKFFEWAVVPALVAGGVMSPWLGAAIIASGGMVGRTAYTLGRLIQMAMRGREKPWVALGVGVLPVVGNAAYPCQIIYTSTERDHQVAQFILYDLFTMVGRLIPIWGGKDTMTEHFFNRWPSVAFKRARRRLPREVEVDERVEVGAAT